MPGPLSIRALSVLFEQHSTPVDLVDYVAFAIVDLCFKKVTCPDYFWHQVARLYKLVFGGTLYVELLSRRCAIKNSTA